MRKAILFILLSVIILTNTVTAAPEMTDVQRNSITMMNYLLAVTKEINDSSGSKLFLENTYNSLINNTHPNAVDSDTQVQLNIMLDTLNSYRMLSEKRTRLAYIYEQNQAKAIKSAIPNPLGLLSAVQSGNPLKIVASVAYMAVDSITSYNSYMEESELSYLRDGWELDDEEAKELHQSRKSAFNYMIDMVQEYNLPGDLALSEAAIDDFIAAKENENVFQRIHFLESEQKIYEGYAYYWLLLGESYYEAEDYEKCIEATEKYLSLNNHIFRFDYDLAKELPMAINAAKELYDTEEYIKFAEKYAELIVANAGNKNWALRYFAAQTYIDLYSLTENTEYLQKAYDITLDNVVFLVTLQRTENSEYLAEIQKLEAKKDATKDEKKEIKQYNDMLVEMRKTELSPVYEPLLINVDLLFELMDKLEIDEAGRQKVDRILHGNGDNLFLVEPLDDLYRIGAQPADYIEVSFEKDEIIKIGDKKSSVLTLPANFVTPDSKITVIVTDADGSHEYTDWKVDKVTRKVNGLVESFDVTYKSQTIASQKYSKDSKVSVILEVKEGYDVKTYEFAFYVVDCSDFLGAQKVEFRRSGK